MNGYYDSQLVKQLIIDRHERVQRAAGRSRLFRDRKRLQSQQRKSQSR